MERERKQQEKKRWAIPWVGLLVLLLFGLWHLRDTYAGATGSGDLWLIKDYMLLLVTVLLLAGLLGWLFSKKKCPLSGLFVLCSLSLGTLYLFVLPPLSAPDEIRHYISAYQLSNQLMGKAAVDEEGFVYIRKEDDQIDNIDGIAENEGRRTLGQVLDEESYRIIHETGWGKRTKEGTMLSVQPPVKTTPLAYLPQALGLTLARLLDGNYLAAAYLGRFFNLLFFVGMVALAIWVLPFGKELAFGVGILPMTLHLAASFSYDGMIVALCFFFASYCLYLAFRKERVSWADIGILAATIAWVGPCKMVYAVVMGFALLIPLKKFGSKQRWLAMALVVLSVFVLAMLLVNSRVLASYASGADNYVSWAQEEGYSLQYLLYNPVKYVEMLYRTLLTQGEFYFASAFGGYLGNLDAVLNVPFVLILVFAGILIVMSFLKPEERQELTFWQKVWIWVLFLVSAVGVMTAMLISWTPLQANYIHGVQGRYFLPLLPFVLLTIKSRGLRLTKNHDRKLLYVLCLGNGYVLLRLFSIVSMRL
ncbi:MAG: DUF2142 domain-containing protein [bacterium]|nr:DUF2142 domain-containing protein [bacterium]